MRIVFRAETQKYTCHLQTHTICKNSQIRILCFFKIRVCFSFCSLTGDNLYTLRFVQSGGYHAYLIRV